ncbi:hypothetical protein [Arthrobacter sp. D2-10]
MLRSLPERVGAAAPDGEAGSAVLEFTFLGLLLLVPVVYLVLTIGAIQGASFAVVGAADQAAKVFVDSETPEEAHVRAQQAVDLAISDFGLPADDAGVTITCGGMCLEPGSSVTVDVDLRVPLPLVPTMPGLNTSAATVDSSATQLVERFG